MLRADRSARMMRVPPRAIALALLILAAASQSGCRSFWGRVRENERSYAIETARTQSKRGQCVEALDALDRGEAILAIDRYAIEAIQTRIRCYEKLGQSELQAAHRRLLDDYYQDEPMAFPSADGTSAFRAHGDLPARFDRPPAWLKIARPRYTTHAQRSKIVGRVVVAFGLAENGRTTRIRVLEMAHPLLASWAIEAVALAKPARGKSDEVPIVDSQRVFVTTFNFEWRWADEPSEITPP